MSVEIANRIIEGSGNSFHAKVARWLEENGWRVLVSPYYMDQSQSKAREIDLIAERAFPIDCKKRHSYVMVRLYVECKYVASHSVFWFTDKDKGAAAKLVSKDGIFPRANYYTQQHHYLSSSDSVAKVFSTESKVQEQDPFYKALNQVLNAFVSMRDREPIDPQLRDGHVDKRVDISFPVIVCSDFSRLYRTEFMQETVPALIAETFQLEVQYAYANTIDRSSEDYFLVDIVAFDGLETFCEKLAHNGRMAAQLVSD